MFQKIINSHKTTVLNVFEHAYTHPE